MGVEMSRYICTIDFYIYSKNDKRAVKLLNWICRKLNIQFDSQAEAVALKEQPFGSLDSRGVKL